MLATTVPRILVELQTITKSSADLSSKVVDEFDGVLAIVKELSTATESQHSSTEEDLAQLANKIDEKTMENNHLEKTIEEQK